MSNIELGACTPEQYEAGKTELIIEPELDVYSIYTWMIRHGEGGGFMQPSRILEVEEEREESPGLYVVKFALLDADQRETMDLDTRFRGGLFIGQANGQPLMRNNPYGMTRVEEGYFKQPQTEESRPATLDTSKIEQELADLTGDS